MYDKAINIASWIALPIIRATERRKASVRRLGFALNMLLFPIFGTLAIPCLLLIVIAGIAEDI